MSTKDIVSHAWKLIHSCVYMIGCIAIWSYTFERWPVATRVVAITGATAALVWYLWHFFVRPFRAAMRGESQ